MRVAMHTTFQASRKDPLAGVIEKIHAAFLAGPGEPFVRFLMADSPGGLMTSAVDRVLKRFPETQRFLSESPMYPGGPQMKRLANGPMSAAPGEQLDWATVMTIASGVPRSFPLHNISIHFQHPAFGDAEPQLGPLGSIIPGIVITDAWWVNGRMRSVLGYTIVEAQAASKKLSALPESVAAVFAACGKVKGTVQTPFDTSPAGALSSPDPEATRKAAEVIQDYKARFPGSWSMRHSRTIFPRHWT